MAKSECIQFRQPPLQHFRSYFINPWNRCCFRPQWGEVEVPVVTFSGLTGDFLEGRVCGCSLTWEWAWTRPLCGHVGPAEGRSGVKQTCYCFDTWRESVEQKSPGWWLMFHTTSSNQVTHSHSTLRLCRLHLKHASVTAAPFGSPETGYPCGGYLRGGLSDSPERPDLLIHRRTLALETGGEEGQSDDASPRGRQKLGLPDAGPVSDGAHQKQPLPRWFLQQGWAQASLGETASGPRSAWCKWGRLSKKSVSPGDQGEGEWHGQALFQSVCQWPHLAQPAPRRRHSASRVRYLYNLYNLRRYSCWEIGMCNSWPTL